MYAIQVLNIIESKELKVKDHPMLWEFKDVFPYKVPRIPPKKDLYFSIDLAPVALPTSKIPYRMSMLELVDLKVQMKEMMDKGYIGLTVSAWGSLALFLKKRDGTM